jgi:hypothetical protein
MGLGVGIAAAVASLQSCAGGCCKCACEIAAGDGRCSAETEEIRGLGTCTQLCRDFCREQSCPDSNPLAESCFERSNSIHVGQATPPMSDDDDDDDDATTPDVRSPCEPEVEGLVSIDAAWDAGCGIDGGGALQCWGSLAGDLVDTPSGSNWAQVSVTGSFACARDEDGPIRCWGSVPDEVDESWEGEYSDVSARYGVVCTITGVGEAECQDGGQTFPGVWFPGAPHSAVTVGARHACVLRGDATVLCDGADDEGQSSNPWPDDSFASVAAGEAHSCAVRPGGGLACWGRGTVTNDVPSGDWLEVAGGSRHACARDASDEVACWGPGTDYDPQPPDEGFVHVAAGGDLSCGLRADGTVRCWGDCEP